MMPQQVGPIVYAIYVNEVRVKDFPLDIELRQTWGQHDVFYLRIEHLRMKTYNNKALWPNNAPVRIIWGQSSSNTNTWYGYVNHHVIDANSDSGSNTMQVTYVCTGTSKPMNTDRTRTWGEVTGTYVAKTLARQYGFRAVLSSTSWVLPYEVQANESDFHFLNRIADKVGYRFWVSGGTLYFIDPAVILQGTGNQAIPKFYMDKSFMYMDTMRNFSMSLGDNIPGGAITTRNIYGINEATGSPFNVKASNAPSSSISQITNEWPVTTVNEARNIVDAWQGRSQFWLAATAEFYGTAYVYPGKLVYLEGDQLNNEATGYWIVSSSDHVMSTSGTTDPTKDRYVTHVQLLKNETNILPKLKSMQKIVPEFVGCSLLSGQWKASSQTVTYDNGV